MLRSDESAVVRIASARRQQFQMPGRRDRLAIQRDEQACAVFNIRHVKNYARRIRFRLCLKNSERSLFFGATDVANS